MILLFVITHITKEEIKTREVLLLLGVCILSPIIELNIFGSSKDSK